jgi:hypothetical protein
MEVSPVKRKNIFGNKRKEKSFTKRGQQLETIKSRVSLISLMKCVISGLRTKNANNEDLVAHYKTLNENLINGLDNVGKKLLALQDEVRTEIKEKLLQKL